MLEAEQKFDCPYCGEPNSVRLDLSAGKRQVLVTDCEVCCKSIRITAELNDAGAASLDVKQEDDGFPDRSGLR